MKVSIGFAVLAASLLSGCASKVITYDADGKMIGKCVASSGFILGAGASCSGMANQEGKGK